MIMKPQGFETPVSPTLTEKFEAETRSYFAQKGIASLYEKEADEIGVSTFRFEKVESPEKSVDTPIILLPGMGNPSYPGGEYVNHITGLLHLGAREVVYMHYPFEKALDVNAVLTRLEVIAKRYPNFKIAGVSLGADLIMEAIHRGILNNAEDVLLLSPFMVAPNDNYGAVSRDIGFGFAGLAPKLAGAIWDLSADYPRTPSTTLNMGIAKNIRNQLTIRRANSITNKVKNLLIYWTNPDDMLGEFAAPEMRASIIEMAKRVSANFLSKTPFKYPHGMMVADENTFITEMYIISWYLRQKKDQIFEKIIEQLPN
jgi:hypothetical protein